MHDKLTPTRAMDELNVERFIYKKDRPLTAKQTDGLKSTKDANGYSIGKIKEEGKTPFESLLEKNRG